jgi:hypothetical protein
MAIDLLVESFNPALHPFESSIDLIESAVHIVPQIDNQVPKVGYGVHPGLEGRESFFYSRHVGASLRAVTARF